MSEVVADNVAGAVIFFAYIATALFFTGYIGRDLASLYNESHNVDNIKEQSIAQVAKRRDRAQLFLALSAVSFATLSYHMLSFLIQSFTTWWQTNGTASSWNLLDGGLNYHGLRSTATHIWSWSTHSMLFQEFAETIVRDPRGFWWTQQALLYSLGWNIYMAVEGTRYQIPHLWAYFVLDQILPVSFTQNLFCAALYLKPSLPQAANLRPAPRGDQFVVLALYITALSTVPNIVGTTPFLAVVVGIRFLLFAPYWMLRPISRSSTVRAGGSAEALYWEYRYAALILIVGGGYLHFRQTQVATPFVETVKAIGYSPAIATLGYDYILGAFSLLAFVGLESVSNVN